MEATSAFGCLAAVTGFASAFAFGSEWARSARVRKAAGRTAATGDSWLGWRLRNGIGPLVPVARVALRRPKVRAAAQEAVWAAHHRGLEAVPEAAVSLGMAAVLVTGAVAWLVSGTALAGVAVAASVGACALAWLGAQRDARTERMRDAVPDALRSMGACFQTGFSLLQTFQQTGRETPGPLGELFDRAARRLEVGEPVGEALAVLREDDSVRELAFAAVALDVQHESGGSVAPVLVAAREAVEGELELRRSLRVQTAQAKLSARVVSVLPFVLIAVFSLVSEGFLEPFFASPVGLAVLATALAMQAAGVLLVRRMLAVEVT